MHQLHKGIIDAQTLLTNPRVSLIKGNFAVN